MKVRSNKLYEIAIQRGVEMSRNKNTIAATGMLMKIGIPANIIMRVLFEPHKTRSTDL